MSDSIFGNPEQESKQENVQATPETAPASAEVAATPQEASDPYADLLTTIKADDGRQKYADVKTALESIPHAQTHIRELNEKLKAMEERLKDASNVDEVLKRLESTQANEERPSQELDETKLAQFLEAQLTAREQAKVQESNRKAVADTLRGAFGEKAEEMYKQTAEELGIELGVMNDLAQRSPAAVLKYFGLDHKKASSNLSKPSVNTAAMHNKPEQRRDPMDMFKSSESDLVKKWREIASKIEG